MRVSVDKDDPGFVGVGRPPFYRVWLDDVEVRYVITADDQAGVVIFLKVDENGLPMMGSLQDEMARETRFGRVRIERL